MSVNSPRGELSGGRGWNLQASAEGRVGSECLEVISLQTPPAAVGQREVGVGRVYSARPCARAHTGSR